MCVYKLDPQFNEEGNCAYRHFGPDTYHPEIKNLLDEVWFRGQPMAESWIPLRTVTEKQTRHLPLPDFDDTVYWPMFSRRAVDALADLLEPNGEILPLICPEGEYFAYNATCLVDILDQERSDMRRVSLHKLVFRTDCLQGLSIFKMKLRPVAHVFVTDLLVNRVRQAGLVGIDFRKLQTS